MTVNPLKQWMLFWWSNGTFLLPGNIANSIYNRIFMQDFAVADFTIGWY
jgi:hypothetical protein